MNLLFDLVEYEFDTILIVAIILFLLMEGIEDKIIYITLGLLLIA